MTVSKKLIYKILFVNQNKVYQLYAKEIYNSEIYGFIEVEAFIFGEEQQTIVDPAEEKLKNEFADVVRSYIPMHAIIRIDEVAKKGTVTISDAQTSNNVTAFPTPSQLKSWPKK